LASGDVSDYYIDCRTAEVSSAAAPLIGEILYERTRDLAVDAIGGLAVGAVPLATAAVISYHLHDRAMVGVWGRDKTKSHGTQNLIEGNLKPGARVVVVEDVITRGSSSVKALREVKAAGCEVVLVLALVDRLQGAEQVLRDEGVPRYETVFTIQH